MKGFEIGDISVTLLIWDILGQNGFPTLRNEYLKKSTGAVLVCDISNKQTLEKLPGWIDTIHGIEPNIPIIIALNKIDTSEPQFSEEDVKSLSFAHVPGFAGSLVLDLCGPKNASANRPGGEQEIVFED